MAVHRPFLASSHQDNGKISAATSVLRLTRLDSLMHISHLQLSSGSISGQRIMSCAAWKSKAFPDTFCSLPQYAAIGRSRARGFSAAALQQQQSGFGFLGTIINVEPQLILVPTSSAPTPPRCSRTEYYMYPNSVQYFRRR